MMPTGCTDLPVGQLGKNRFRNIRRHCNMNAQAEIMELRDHVRTGEPPDERHARTWYTAQILDTVRADI